MRFARLASGTISEATTGAKATCPGCEREVIAKCGPIVTWHWSHLCSDCDPWYEPMSEWHRKWQARFPVQQTEVVMRHGGEHHRADVVIENGGVLELQASRIETKEIQSRERFYGHMAWLFRCDWFDRLRFVGRVRCRCSGCEPQNATYTVTDRDGSYSTGLTADAALQTVREWSDDHRQAWVTKDFERACRAEKNGAWKMRWTRPRRSMLSIKKPMFWHVERERGVWEVSLEDEGEIAILHRKWSEDQFAKACLRAHEVRLSA